MSAEIFPQLVEAHYAGLYRFALSLARNASDAADLTQQTFYVWAAKGHMLRDRAKVKTWLFTTLYREFLRTRRGAARTTALEDLPVAEQDPPDVGVDVVNRLDAELVLAALQEVPLTFREPLALFYLQDLSYVEIADVLGVPVGTVMSRLSRGKSHLRLLLAQKARGGEVIEFPQRQARP